MGFKTSFDFSALFFLFQCNIRCDDAPLFVAKIYEVQTLASNSLTQCAMTFYIQSPTSATFVSIFTMLCDNEKFQKKNIGNFTIKHVKFACVTMRSPN